MFYHVLPIKLGPTQKDITWTSIVYSLFSVNIGGEGIIYHGISVNYWVLASESTTIGALIMRSKIREQCRSRCLIKPADFRLKVVHICFRQNALAEPQFYLLGWVSFFRGARWALKRVKPWALRTPEQFTIVLDPRNFPFCTCRKQWRGTCPYMSLLHISIHVLHFWMVRLYQCDVGIPFWQVTSVTALAGSSSGW